MNSLCRFFFVNYHLCYERQQKDKFTIFHILEGDKIIFIDVKLLVDFTNLNNILNSLTYLIGSIKNKLFHCKVLKMLMTQIWEQYLKNNFSQGWYCGTVG